MKAIKSFKHGGLKNGYEPSCAEHMLYQILRGKDWTTMFTPITNEVKIINGQAPWGSLRKAAMSLYYAKFVGIFGDILIKEVVTEFLRTKINFDFRGEGDGYL